jgi:pantetheine-phosphate adenylyltransferase
MAEVGSENIGRGVAVKPPAGHYNPPMPSSTPQPTATEHLALYAGSFDPITLGHLDVLQRARRLFDRIILGIGHNPDKPALFSFSERLDMARKLVSDMVASNGPGAPVQVQKYTGLTVDFARKVNAACIIRGIRNITDLATETQLAITNRQVADIETVFIVTGETFAFTSSSLIKQVAALGGSLDRLASIVPPLVIERLAKKRNDPADPLGKLARDLLIE